MSSQRPLLSFPWLLLLLLLLLGFRFIESNSNDDAVRENNNGVGTVEDDGSAAEAASIDERALNSNVVDDSDATDEEDDEYYDERTLLDSFGEAAKIFLTQKVIPPTDAECKWDWRYVRCEPYCSCTFAPKKGDYHLGRSCRIEEKPDCNESTTPRPTANSLQLIIQRMVQGSQHVIRSGKNKSQRTYQKLQSRVCDQLPEMDCNAPGGIPQVAWQQRALCRHMIPTCIPVDDETVATLPKQLWLEEIENVEEDSSSENANPPDDGNDSETTQRHQ